MILVLSYDTYEQCTDPVIGWLNYYRAPFLKLTQQDLTENKRNIQFDADGKDVILEGKSLQQEVNVVWFRRFLKGLVRQDGLNAVLNKEIRSLLMYFVYLLKDKKWLPPYEACEPDKLSVLNLAGRLGIRVPRTKILNNKKDLLDFYRKMPGGLITKPISHAHYIQQGANTWMTFTKKLSPGDLEEIPETFFPSLFQEHIPARYELRVFYLDGEFFPAAMIGKSPGQEISDIKYQRMTGKVHYLPYQLRTDESRRLHRLMQGLSLNTASIDLLKCGGELILLEVNPAGQFLYESARCNWYLEKKIAEWLIKNDRHVPVKQRTR